jgi:hypothetical protein
VHRLVVQPGADHVLKPRALPRCVPTRPTVVDLVLRNEEVGRAPCSKILSVTKSTQSRIQLSHRPQCAPFPYA